MIYANPIAGVIHYACDADFVMRKERGICAAAAGENVTRFECCHVGRISFVIVMLKYIQLKSRAMLLLSSSSSLGFAVFVMHETIWTNMYPFVEFLSVSLALAPYFTALMQLHVAVLHSI